MAMHLDQRFFSWSAAKGIRHLNISAYFQVLSAIIPVYASIAYVFQVKTGQNLPVPVNLFALYFSSLFFFLGTCIFDVFCPRIVKEHPSRYVFVQDCIKYSELTMQYARQSEKAVSEIVSAILSKKREDAGEKANPKSGFVNLDSAYNAEMDVASTVALKKVWMDKNFERQSSLALVGLCYLLSFSIGAYVTFWDAPRRVILALGF